MDLINFLQTGTEIALTIKSSDLMEFGVYSGDVDPHSGMIVTPPYSEGQPEGQPCFD